MTSTFDGQYCFKDDPNPQFFMSMITENFLWTLYYNNVTVWVFTYISFPWLLIKTINIPTHLHIYDPNLASLHAQLAHC